MIDRLRALARAGRTALVRVAHPWRRRRAIRALEEGPAVGHLLFVCLGNVCRSPWAEVRMRELVEARRPAPDMRIESAGFIKPGRPSPDRAQEIARERGLDLSAHVSRLLASCPVGRDSLVVVMEPGQVAGVRRAYGPEVRTLVLGDLDPEPPERRLIPDPWGRGGDVFRASYDRIDRCLEVLLHHAGGRA